jgi:hypothetical protein
MTKDQLLAEVEDLIRTMPPEATLDQHNSDNFSWFGRLSAVINAWNPIKAALLSAYQDQFRSWAMHSSGYARILTVLHEARHDLRMQTAGPINTALPHGEVFRYFDEIRKIIESAKNDLLFVDPYLDAEFVSRYMGHVSVGVTTRLLAREKLPILLPAVDLFAKQTKSKIEVRSSPNFHDRYVFVDRTECYQSGASFKDGAKTAPTTLTQITDAFAAMLQTYENIWSGAKVER